MQKLGITIFAIVFAIPFFAFALPTTFPNPTGFVMDTANVLSLQTKQSLELELQNFAKTNGYEIAVLTVPNMDGDTVEDYAVKVFEKWKIGDKKLDTGVLFLVSIEDRKMRIEVGYGTEPVLTDTQSSLILENTVKPYFKSGQYNAGISAGVKEIENVLSGEPVKLENSPKTAGNVLSKFIDFFGFWIFALPIILFQLVFTSVLKFLAKSKSWWLGGVAAGLLSALIIFIFFGVLALMFKILLIIIFSIFGFVLDFLVSKYGYKTFKDRNIWFLGGGFGGGRGGGFSGGGFGGFGGGSSGGGGSSSSW